ncbi:hypothetical protein ACLOJK_013209 [Asimina triloba]
MVRIIPSKRISNNFSFHHAFGPTTSTNGPDLKLPSYVDCSTNVAHLFAPPFYAPKSQAAATCHSLLPLNRDSRRDIDALCKPPLEITTSCVDLAAQSEQRLPHRM